MNHEQEAEKAHREHHEALELQSQPPSDLPFLTWSLLLNFPNSTIKWGSSIQMPKTMREGVSLKPPQSL